MLLLMAVRFGMAHAVLGKLVQQLLMEGSVDVEYHHKHYKLTVESACFSTHRFSFFPFFLLCFPSLCHGFADKGKGWHL